MKNWFSVKLYLEGLKKIKTAGIASAIIVIALNAIVPTFAIIDSNMSWPGQVRTVSTVPIVGFAPFNLLMMLLGAILAASMFSYLNERNKCDFWHAVPHKRTCVYFSFVASIWTWILGIIIASSLVNLLLWVIAKYYIVSVSTFFVSIAVYFLAAIMMATFMILAMSITGTTISNLLIMALLMLFVRVIGVIFVTCVQDITAVLDIDYSILRILKFDFCLPIALLSFRASVFGDALLLLYSLGVVIFLVALGAVCYHWRSSETATKSAPNATMQHIYRCAVTLPFVFLIATFGVMGIADTGTVVILVILSLLTWIIFELMTTKKFKNVLKSFPVLIVPIAVSVVLCCGAFMIRNAVWNHPPEADEIKGVTITGNAYGTKTYEQLKVSGLVVGNDDINRIVSDSLKLTIEKEKKDMNYGVNTRHVVIHLRSGKTLGRYIAMDNETYSTVRNRFYQSEEYRQAFLSLPSTSQIHDIYFSDAYFDKDTAKRLWASFLYEYNQLSDAEKRVIKEYDNELGEAFDEEVKETLEKVTQYNKVGIMCVSGAVGLELFESDYPIFYEYMPETAKMYLELYNENDSYYFGAGAASEIKKIGEMLRKGFDSSGESKLGGNLYFQVLCGRREIDMFFVDFSSKEKTCRAMIEELTAVLDNLERPEQYAYNKEKTVIYCCVETNMMENFATEEEFKSSYDEKYYYYGKIPLALTDEEVDRIVDIYLRYFTKE